MTFTAADRCAMAWRNCCFAGMSVSAAEIDCWFGFMFWVPEGAVGIWIQA
jgi:hypothetical protein